MKHLSIIIAVILLLSSIEACHHDKTYPNTQSQFAYDPNYRIGKWYSISDTTGNALLEVNTLLDTIWFINDSLAGWTGFVPYQPRTYVFWKTYIDPKSIYNLIYLAPDYMDTTKIDTISHQFGFNEDTMTIYWNFWTTPPQTERYLKKKQ